MFCNQTNKLRRTLAGLVSAFLLLALNQAAFADAELKPAKGLMWEIKAGQKTAYLLGSIHLAKPDFYPLTPAVEDAYAKSRVLAVEVDATDQKAIAKLMPLVIYKAPDQLDKHISAETWSELNKVAGPAIKQLQMLKPALVSTGLVVGAMMSQGYQPQAGIDVYFLNRAKAENKKIKELETLAFQLKVLTDFSDKEGDEMLASTLTSIQNGDAVKESDNLVAAWKSGDAPALEKILADLNNKDAATAKLMKRLLDDRNAGMSEKIIKLMNGGQPVFVVVGAGHMIGKNSILDLLKKKGFQINRVE
ncbi:TraB/GumN family protein [Undibacterium sp. Jales W-56]|uniref:TraB/GumN family protein n=1 Tax=Undibacterium sp. Jales W-56 TaxID=2897325 RepID=UPI0021CFE848|nr:TraB/GumN family protein [Undibacterium sp. Jales W-56]MCU6432433.1 TraB/GumN family protein [Undibacterium sp. Jales W-56]